MSENFEELDSKINQFLVEENVRLQKEIEDQRAMHRAEQAATQNALNALTEDLKKRGEQIGQAMLNLSSIASAIQNVSSAVSIPDPTLRRIATALEELVEQGKDDDGS